MGELLWRPISSADKFDVCDNCGQEGVVSSGRMMKDAYGEDVIFICYNCISQGKVK
jgi:hypothetical protein